MQNNEIGFGFSEAYVPHLGSIINDANALVFTEGLDEGWHLIAVPAQKIWKHRARLKLKLEILSQRVRFLYFAHSGGVNLGFVNIFNGEVHRRVAEDIVCIRNGNCLDIELIYDSNDNKVLFGSASGVDEPIYRGAGLEIFKLTSFLAEPASYPAGTRPNLTLVDIGAANGLHPKWAKHSSDLNVIFVEPEPAAAKLLEDQTQHVEKKTIIPYALSDRDGLRSLNITKFSECSSLLDPDEDMVGNWKAAPLFVVSKRIEVNCRSFESIHQEMNLANPEFIKIDVQGSELDILRGFGELLYGCLGIEVEAHFYRIYKNQPLITDIVDYLYGFGLFLRCIKPCQSFGDDLVEVDAFFIRRLSADATAEAKEKINFIEEVLEIKKAGC